MSEIATESQSTERPDAPETVKEKFTPADMATLLKETLTTHNQVTIISGEDFADEAGIDLAKARIATGRASDEDTNITIVLGIDPRDPDREFYEVKQADKTLRVNPSIDTALVETAVQDGLPQQEVIDDLSGWRDRIQNARDHGRILDRDAPKRPEPAVVQSRQRVRQPMSRSDRRFLAVGAGALAVTLALGGYTWRDTIAEISSSDKEPTGTISLQVPEFQGSDDQVANITRAIHHTHLPGESDHGVVATVVKTENGDRIILGSDTTPRPLVVSDSGFEHTVSGTSVKPEDLSLQDNPTRNIQLTKPALEPGLVEYPATPDLADAAAIPLADADASFGVNAPGYTVLKNDNGFPMIAGGAYAGLAGGEDGQRYQYLYLMNKARYILV